MSKVLLTVKLKHKIIETLSKAYPEAMSARQYLALFDKYSEFEALAIITTLVREGYISSKAIMMVDNSPELIHHEIKLSSRKAKKKTY